MEDAKKDIDKANISNITDTSALSTMSQTISSYYSSGSIKNCSTDSDCLNGGTCVSYQCSCAGSYWGVNCNFTSTDQTAAISANTQLLTQVTTLVQNATSEQTTQIAQTLVSVTSVKETNNYQTVTSTLDLIETVSNITTRSEASTGLIMSAISNIVDIVTSTTTTTTSTSTTVTTSTMQRVINTVTTVIDNQLNTIGSQINIKTNNLQVKGKVIDTSDTTSMTTSLTQMLTTTDTTVTTSVSVSISTSFISKLSTVSGGAAVSATTWTKNPHGDTDTKTNINSNVFSLSVKDKNKNKVSIKDLPKPLKIKIPKKGKNNEGKQTKCKYYDEPTLSWSEDGVVTTEDTDDHISCEVTHLTDFGGSEQVIIDTVIQNTNTNIISSSSDVWYTLVDNFGIWAWVIYAVLTIFMVTSFGFMKVSKCDADIEHIETEGVRLKDIESPGEKIGLSDGKTVKHAVQEDKEAKEMQQTMKCFRISPFVSIYHAHDKLEGMRKTASFVLYVTIISMFLACLYSSPNLDVILLIL